MAKLDALFGQLETLKTGLALIPELLKKFRQTVLNQAVTGKLTEDWREENHPKLWGQELLNKIQAERGKRYNEEVKRAKIKKRRPNYNVPDHLSSTSADELKRMPLIPESWLYCKLENLGEIVRGASPRPASDPRYFGGNIPWITVAEITKDEDVYLTQVSSYLTEEGKANSRYVNSSTLMLTNSGATLGVPKILKIGGCSNDGSIAFADISLTDQLYLYYVLKEKTLWFRSLNKGAAQPNLNTDIVKNTVAPLPPLEEQQEIVRRVEALLARADALQAQYEQLRATVGRLPQAILAKAFRGELVPQDPADSAPDSGANVPAHEDAASLLAQAQRQATKLSRTIPVQTELFGK